MTRVVVLCHVYTPLKTDHEHGKPTNHLKMHLLKEIGDFPACHVRFSAGVKDTNYFLGNDPI